MTTVNGRPAEPEGTVLSTCRRAGADVPAFCHDDRVAAEGHCRSCLVEVDGRLVAACTTAAAPAQVIVTDSPRLNEYRRDLGDLMLSHSRPGGVVLETLKRWGSTGSPYTAPAGTPAPDDSHPYLKLNLDACILCRLCERVCSDVQGQFVYAVAGRGSEARLGYGPEPFAKTDCVSCGACASVCPSGAITDVDRLAASPSDAVVRSTCSYCGVGCQLEVNVGRDRVTRIEGAASSVNRQHLCVKGRYAHTFSRHPDRLTTPLLRRTPGAPLTPVSWDEAIAFIVERFARMNGQVALLSSSRCTNEENYLAQKWFRVAYRTNTIDCCARVCHAPSAAGMRRSFGTGAATNSLADIELADAILLSGANTTESHPVTGARIKQAALRGARLIVIDPRRSELARMADVHLQVNPGTNVPLLNSLAAVIVEENLVSPEFIQARTTGFDAYSRFIRGFRPEVTAAITGVPAEFVRRAARIYATARRPMQMHGLGLTEHYQGSESVQLLCNLALLVGAVGRPGSGVNPLRGQNNVQGAADMGCAPDSFPGYQSVADPRVRAKFESAWGCPLPPAPGLTLPKIYDAIREGKIRGMFILGEDVAQTDPDATRVREALGRLECLVVQELFLSETAKLATVVLPGASFLEKDGTFTNGERRIQRVRQAITPPGAARPDWRILRDLMAAAGVPAAYDHPSEIMDEIARLVPSFAGVSYARLEPDGLQWPVPSAGHPGTPTLHADAFPIGRAPLACVEYLPSPSALRAAGRLLLVTGRALEHYNSGSMTRRGANLDLMDRDYVQIHPDDAAALSLHPGDRVAITSDFGTAEATAQVTDRVAPGTLFATFHFPESGINNVTSDVVDRLSDCPEYKLTPVTIAAKPTR